MGVSRGPGTRVTVHMASHVLVALVFLAVVLLLLNPHHRLVLLSGSCLLTKELLLAYAGLPGLARRLPGLARRLPLCLLLLYQELVQHCIVLIVLVGLSLVSGRAS
jgi:hypothetical protein